MKHPASQTSSSPPTAAASSCGLRLERTGIAGGVPVPVAAATAA